MKKEQSSSTNEYLEYHITEEEYKIAEMNGISRYTADQRVNRYFWNKEDAIRRPAYAKFRKSGVLSEEEYKIAESNGISRILAYRRYEYLFWSKEDAITKPNRKGKKKMESKSSKTFNYVGLTEEDYKIAESNGIKRKTAYERFERHFWSKEDAITKPVYSKVKGNKASVFTEEEYKIAEMNGISRNTAYCRYEKLFWDKEDCITRPLKEKKYEEKIPKDIYKRAKENGIRWQTLHNRIRKLGWKPEVACEVPILKGSYKAYKDMLKEKYGINNYK